MARVNPQAAPKVSSNTASRKTSGVSLDAVGVNDGVPRTNTKVKATKK